MRKGAISGTDTFEFCRSPLQISFFSEVLSSLPRVPGEEAFTRRQKEETAFRLEQNAREGRNALGANRLRALQNAIKSEQRRRDAEAEANRNKENYEREAYAVS